VEKIVPVRVTLRQQWVREGSGRGRRTAGRSSPTGHEARRPLDCVPRPGREGRERRRGWVDIPSWLLATRGVAPEARRTLAEVLVEFRTDWMLSALIDESGQEWPSDAWLPIRRTMSPGFCGWKRVQRAARVGVPPPDC
jgi:hypothetical protein